MFTKIECSQCGSHFVSMPFDRFGCTGCDHEVTSADLLPNMEEGETLYVRDCVLGYVTED